MQTISWTTGTGAKIEITVTTAFGLDLQGRRKSAGRKMVVIAATINGKAHNCPMGLQKANHPVAVGKIGDIGLTRENFDRVSAAIAGAELEIAAHNAACDAHEDRLDAVSAASSKIENAMKCGE